MTDLFGHDEGASPAPAGAPLAERMRPRTLDEVVGQGEALGPGSPLRAALDARELPSLVLWGPPGCGKTTLARCLAREVDATFLPYSAVSVGVKELKAAMADARRLRAAGGRAPLLFLDEIHRFNRGQQDALLPWVEAGDVTLVGATTENPGLQVNAALLSRCRLVVLEPLGVEDMVALLRRALDDDERGLGGRGLEAREEALARIAAHSGGDARFALGSLELAAQRAQANDGPIDAAVAEAVLAQAHLLYDRAGEEHYNLISALHKSLRNSDAQAGLYWMARMLESGEDPMYVARRLVRLASEDIGLADPQALVQANAAAQAVQLLGMPEAALALAQATVYLAQAPKSNALYTAYKAVQGELSAGRTPPVPRPLRNAVGPASRQLKDGEGYRYAHDDPEGVSPLECLPTGLEDRIFYRPTERGFEAEAAQRLRRAWRLARRERPGQEPGQEQG